MNDRPATHLATATASGGIGYQLRRGAVSIERAWLPVRRFDLVAMLTAIMLVIYVAGRGQTPTGQIAAAGMGVLAMLALIVPALRRGPWVWALIALVSLYADVYRGLDRWVYNHRVLIAYWCLAMVLATIGSQRLQTLRINARLIIGLCFLFATFWKVVSPEFPDGTFFEFTLLIDDRFRGMAELAAGISPEDLHANTEAVAGLVSPASTADHVVLAGSDRVPAIAGAMAIWTIVLEGLIAVTWLCPARWRIARLRHPALVAFIVTTYPIATVTNFARLLALLAVAGCGASESRARLLYVAAFVAVPLFSIPWVWVLRPIFGG